MTLHKAETEAMITWAFLWGRAMSRGKSPVLLPWGQQELDPMGQLRAPESSLRCRQNHGSWSTASCLHMHHPHTSTLEWSSVGVVDPASSSLSRVCAQPLMMLQAWEIAMVSCRRLLLLLLLLLGPVPSQKPVYQPDSDRAEHAKAQHQQVLPTQQA